MRVSVLYPNQTGDGPDGVRDHGRHLAAAINGLGHVAILSTAPEPGFDLTIVQYTPFTWGRGGLAPLLTRRLAKVRAEGSRLSLMVHEPHLVGGGVKDRALGQLQKQQLLRLGRGVDDVFASIETWTEELAASLPGTRVRHLPVGSNLPDERHNRESHRRRLGLAPDDVVIAAFDSPHPGRSRDLLESTVEALGDAGVAAVWLLGAEARDLDHRGLGVTRPGPLPPEALARMIAAADLFLAPFVDGVSTRRTTVASARQHGVPVLGTSGHLTDPSLVGDIKTGVRLVPISDPAAFVEAAIELVADQSSRRTLGREGRAAFEADLQWPTLAARFFA